MAELVTILCQINCFRFGTNQLYVVLIEHTVVEQIKRTVKTRLPTHSWQYRIRLFALYNFFHNTPVYRLYINCICCGRISHDRRRVGVDQHHTVSLFTQRFTRLRTGVVKLTGLPYDNRTGTDDQDAFNIATTWHAFSSDR